MTTAQSPLRLLKAQADKIAATIKATERGEKIDVRFAAPPRSSGKGIFKVGIVMDDKTITIEMPWATIGTMSESALAEYILGQMRATRKTMQ